jgi:hypothetical protein
MRRPKDLGVDLSKIKRGKLSKSWQRTIRLLNERAAARHARTSGLRQDPTRP